MGIYQKIVAITCDGGENLVAACNQLDIPIKRIWCCAHRLHLVVINGLGIWNKQKKLDYNKTNHSIMQTTNPMLNDNASENSEQSMDTSWSDESVKGEGFSLIPLILILESYFRILN